MGEMKGYITVFHKFSQRYKSHLCHSAKFRSIIASMRCPGPESGQIINSSDIFFSGIQRHTHKNFIGYNIQG